MRRAAVQWVRNVPQRDGGRMTDGQLDGRTQRCEELSGKGKALSNGVQSDAIDAGPRRVARKRGVAACGGITAFTLGRAAPSE